MATTVRNLRAQHRVGDWLRPHLRWTTVPSWMMSAIVHVGLVALLLTLSQLKSCRPDIEGDGGESLRQIGIYQRPPAADPSTSLTDAEPEVPDDVPFTSQELSSVQTVQDVPSEAPVPLALPETLTTSVVGIGSPTVSLPSAQSLLKPSTSAGAGQPRAGGGAPQATSLFGARDVGNRFVYVIDRSWSMDGDGTGASPLNVAKDELAASLQRLNGSQEFQMIFYNTDGPVTLSNHSGRFDLFWATDTQRLDAIRQLRSIQANGGTDHIPALLRALKFNPDVIFFLTDGQEPMPSDNELRDITRRNTGARIHCIEFGTRTPIVDAAGVEAGNWLQKLAAENDGQYRYHDVRKFRR